MNMAASSNNKPPPVIDKLSNVDFQAEVEIICNFLRWESYPKSSTENFKRILEKRAQTFCVEEYVPTDDASPALPWQLFYTGSPESTGDEQVEDLLEAGEPPHGQGCKRLVIPHPRQQRNILNKAHNGKEGSGVHLSVNEMWEKVIPVYYWRHIGTSIIDFIKNCEVCRLQGCETGPGTSPGTCPGTSTETCPGTSTGICPGTSTGTYPGTSTGICPGTSTGICPGTSTGTYPGTSTGICPGTSTGTYPGTSTGICPGTSTGTYPGTSTGICPGTSTGTYPGTSTGICPGTSTGTYPGTSTGICPGTSTGTYPGTSTGTYPGTSTGICPGTSTGTCPGTSPGTSHETSTSDFKSDLLRATELKMEDDDDGSFESFQLSNEIPYQEEVSQIYDYLKTGKYPANSAPNFKRGLRRKAHQYVLADDDTDGTNGVSSKKLYFLKAQERKAIRNAGAGGDVGEEIYRRLVVPFAEEQQKILQIAHIGASGEHCGRNKMLSSISKLYFWKGLYQSIMSFLESCSECRTKRLDAKARSLEQPAKMVKGEGIVTRSRTAYNTIASQKEHFTRRTAETFAYLKYRSYPPNSSPDAKRDIRRRSHCFTIAQSEAEEWPEIYGHSEPEEKLYYLKKIHKQPWQEDDYEEDDEDREQDGRPVRRLVVTTEEEQNVAIMKVHVDENGIHNSRTRTLNRLAACYYWVDMKTSVNDYIDNCSCTLASRRKEVRQEHLGPSRDRLALNRFSIKLQKVSRVPPQEMKPKPPLPQELTELPKGLSRVSCLSTEVEALVLYLYLKWQKYPPECSDGFKRMVRKKARSFFFQEDGGDDGENNWCLYYKGDLNREHKDAGLVVAAEETMGDAVNMDSAESQEAIKMEEPGDTEEAMETSESKEIGETGEAVPTPEIIESEVTVETDTTLTEKPVVVRKEKSVDYRTRTRLFVFRRRDQEKILQLVHLHGGKNGEHAGRDRVSNIISRHFFWRGLRDDIMVIIMKCKRCQLKKTVGRSTEYTRYLQEVFNDGHQNSYEDAFEDQSSHQLPPRIQTYLANAMRMEADWDAQDVALRLGTVSGMNYNGSVTEGDQAMHGRLEDVTTEQSRITDGGSSSFLSHGCDSCPRRFRVRDTLRRHKWAEHGGGRTSIECTHCGKVFKKRQDLSVHMRCHTKEKPFECEYCKKRFSYRGGLTHHRKLHFGFKPFVCPECPQRYVSRSDLNMHFRSSHEDSGDYQCDVCGKSFVTPVRLDKHKKIHMESRERFVCEICGKVLASAFSLKFHMHIHTGERHILCELCGKGFKKKCDLAKHMQHHMGIKPHQCHLCQQRFCLKGDLQDHLRVHQGASLYQCDVCHKKFKNKRSMARCKRRHGPEAAPEEGFHCSTCGEVLATLVDFTQHMEAHVGAQIVQQEVEI